MSLAVPGLPLGVDPLIAEAKERARRRRFLALAAVAVIGVGAVVAGATLSSRSASIATGCAPPGWQEQSVRNFGTLQVRPTLVLTNFRFGRMSSSLYGLDSIVHWPAGGVMVAVGVGDPSRDPAYHVRRSFRVTSRDFETAFEQTPSPLAYIATRSHGRLLTAYVEVGSITPATLAAANQALAGVHTCSA